MTARWALGLLAPALSLSLSCSDPSPTSPPAPLVSTAPCTEPAFAGAPLGLRCGKLIDTHGRVVALRGVNARVDGVFDVSFDDGRTALETVPPFTDDDALQMRAWGFDALRLPINWSGVEPTADGGFREEYLDRVQQVVERAQAAGLLVLIDFHQDAYGKDIGEDGAPLWAIQPPPTELLQGPLTDLADRRTSAQVKAAFATFFGDQGAPLRERFSAMTAHVASRFRDHPAVLGFELFNEPVFGSDAALLRLHQQVFAAVRGAAPTKLVFFEPSAERNFFDAAPLATTPLGPGTVYAPHAYKYAFTTFPSSATRDALAPQVLKALDEAASWQAGLGFTEWGYDPNGKRAEDYLTWQSELQEQAQASSFFWLWKEDSQGSWGCFDRAGEAWQERTRLRQVLARVRPAAVAGWPKEYRYDRASGAFSLTFTADPTATASTRIAVAPILGAPLAASCDGVAFSPQLDPQGLLTTDCGRGSSTDHTVTLSLPPLP